MEIIAHRGESYLAPENTLAAVKLAWELNADAVEVDVHLSKDGKLVVIHDNNTRRTGGVDRKLRGQTLAELKALDVGRWKGAQWAGERIPTLEEVVATVPAGPATRRAGKRRLLIEIKCGPEAVPTLESVLAQSGKDLRHFVPASFSLQVMQEVRRRLPTVETHLIADLQDGPKEITAATIGALIGQATESRLNGLNLRACDALTADEVARIKAAGLKLCVWTVDSVPLAQRMVALGVDAITTNRAAWVKEQLKLRS